jgi:hypothetical protein
MIRPTATRRPLPLRLPGLLLSLLLLASCGGGGGESSIADAAMTAASSADAAPARSTGAADTGAAPPATPPRPAVVLPPPVLSFNDTGISISDGLTFNGKWSVTSPLDGLGWEYSLDMGRTWTKGEGDGFEVSGDGPKTIWVRTFDVFGNTSEIVMTSCTLDTAAPMALQVEPLPGALLPAIRIDGLEPMATWAYSVDEQRSWIPGRGGALAFAGNTIGRVWTRQVDAAGNPSPAVATALDDPTSPGWIEASGAPLQPTALPAWEGTLLLHGEVWRADTDFVRFDVPAGQRLKALRLVRYASPDEIAFYALQRGPVFDAGTDVRRMIAWKHLGPPDLLANLLEAVDPGELGPGTFVLWINQTGEPRTGYAIEVEIGPS